MTTQPEALRMAEDLEIDYFGDVVAHDAAAELRRLSAENERIGPLAERVLELKAQRDALLEALRWTARALDHDHPAAIKARAVIKAVEEET